jgi:diguanylate cyclase (GGDEF)-like protein/PAS domain S-box-containing protein
VVQRISNAFGLNDLRSVVGGVPVILFALDQEGRYTLSEGGGLATLGRAPGASVGWSIFGLYPDQPAIHDGVRRALAGEPTTATVTVGDISYQAQYAPLRNPAGAVVGVVGLGVDITARRRAEEALAASEAEYRALVAALADGVVMQAADGRIVAANPSAERILGLSLDQLAGRTSLDPRWRAVHADGTPFPGAEHPAMVALATGQPQTGVAMGIHKPDGTRSWLVVNARPLTAPGESRPHAVVATFTDVTAQREAAEILARSEARFRALTEQSSDLVAITDKAGAVRYRSPSATRLLGYPTDIPPTSNIFGMAHPEDRARVRDYLDACLATTDPLPPLEVRLRHRDGSWPHFETVATNLLDDPAVGGIVFTSRDITARRAAEAALRESEAQLQDFLEHASDLIQSVDEYGRLVYANRAWRETLGYAEAALAGLSVFDIVAPEEREHCRATLAHLLDDGATEAIETVFVARDGRRIAVEGRVNCRATPGGARLTRGIFRDVTARRALEARLSHQATHDALTGLPNRALFLDRLAGALARANRAHAAPCVLYLDLDGFKGVNDRLGHAAGDLLLAATARRLLDCVRAGDTVARLGGDEFAVLLEPFTGRAEAKAMARRIITALGVPVFVGTDEARVAASVGVALATPDDSADTLLSAADAAMYRAKRSGAGRYMMADERRAPSPRPADAAAASVHAGRR